MSLRDVERAMIVFEYFYENMEYFAGLIDEKQQEEERLRKAGADQISEREKEDRNDERMEEDKEDHIQAEMV